MAYRAGVDPEQVIGGVVIELFDDNSYRVRGTSGEFPDKIPREESNEYIKKLIQEIMRVRA